MLNYALNEERLRYFSLENYIIYWDLEEVVYKLTLLIQWLSRPSQCCTLLSCDID